MADPLAFPSYYAWAVYNLAGHFLVTYAQDIPPSTYFADLRAQLNLNSFTPGLIQSSQDVSTSQSFVVPNFAKDLTLGNLQMMQDPWGRAYMALAQAYGPTIWGLTP